jgi:hypothetical protein
VEGTKNLVFGPGGRGELDGRAVVLVEVQQTAGRMAYIVEGRKIAFGATMVDETTPPKLKKQLYITRNALTYVSWH